MKLPFKEPVAPRYIYINPQTNVVHLLMPVMSGTEIGLDNTCKSVYSLLEFFCLLGANQQSAASMILKNYQEGLAFDIKYHPNSEQKALKEQRLVQINMYLRLLQQVQQEEQITNPLKLIFPTYPAALESLMQASEANLHSVILRPEEQDVQLRTTAISPVFSAHHDTMVNGQRIEKKSSLYEILSNSYEGLVFIPKSKEQLIERVLSKCADSPVDFEHIRAMLTQETKAYLGIEESFNQTQGNRYAPSAPVNQAYIDGELMISAEYPATPQDYLNALLEYCTPNLFDNIEESPFYTINNKERLSILTQFFLAELNIICREEGIAETNFGQILEANPELINNLAKCVKQALTGYQSVEDALINYVNQHRDDFQFTSPIPQYSFPKLKERFNSHYKQIKDSPHFDEFMLLSTKKGLFFAHQGCIATHFAHFMNALFFNDILDENTKTFLQSVQQDFETIDKFENTIPHQNTHINAGMKEAVLDLSSMDNEALQDLYEDINSYQDSNLKEALLAQLKQERPDFKLQMNAKIFLQHVAYGEQDEAEELLNKDPELTQELLRANNIFFTDYSGRTFTCTAYEYAYWAKDSHMQRMLEKYIRQDDETRQFMLERVKAIEELVNPPEAERFFAHPKPRGLHYTTQNKEGKTIDHWEAHVDLTPLKKALQHFLDEFKKLYNNPKPNNYREMLNNIWVKEVGMAQRCVPAHIAQEYCRVGWDLFLRLKDNKALFDASNPNNLKRQLKIFDWNTYTYDLWFTPGSHAVDCGLGFSCALIRGGNNCPRPTNMYDRWTTPNEVVEQDLEMISIIDEVRTCDLKQSLENLSQPLIAQAAQYLSI
ncbi:TPA: hypothetical protein ACGAEL_000771 [Legionella pneumophila]|uniref:hypothetical protein n=1 Tax=Legionella pneumophila TaxID=446 RepID=UPI0005B1D531|nr:hypothetical protein [Legionella pneumophila]HAT9814453.1 hypothetical protein [Legionella pneumophila subsp. pneumophila]MCK1859518.1 hypothetical protein [Legionella pneumophila]MCK1870820.1 hypothetical protein [Legionella pneumophila]MCZ4757843.1 hypothetical protein [Legionella pneumophila]MDI2079699.1 hypothetical protein [Legionella pneumophila]